MSLDERRKQRLVLSPSLQRAIVRSTRSERPGLDSIMCLVLEAGITEALIQGDRAVLDWATAVVDELDKQLPEADRSGVWYEFVTGLDDSEALLKAAPLAALAAAAGVVYAACEEGYDGLSFEQIMDALARGLFSEDEKVISLLAKAVALLRYMFGGVAGESWVSGRDGRGAERGGP